jgi:hypothetical protein
MDDKHQWLGFVGMRLLTCYAIAVWVYARYELAHFERRGTQLFDYSDFGIGLMLLSMILFAFAAIWRGALGLKSWVAKVEFLILLLGTASFPLACLW